MSHAVYIQVTIPVRGHDGVRKLALRCLNEDWRLDYDCSEADRFLEDIANGVGYSWGNEGDLIVWGMIGNWTKPQLFVDLLNPFWAELLGEVHEDYPEPSHKIVVIYQEQDAATGAFQLGFDDPESPNRRLITEHFQDLPFTWNI